jgi:tRNA(fMet)-specific endonuclease VapC
MIYILDTDTLSLLARKDSEEGPHIRRRIVGLPTDDSVVTTVVNYEEQIRGWMALLSRAKSTSAELSAYLAPINTSIVN